MAEMRPEADGDSFDEVQLSLEGMKYLLNNDWEKSQKLFSQYKDHSTVMCAGNSLVTFTQAMMSFEEEQLHKAMKVLQETEKKCSTKSGVFKSLGRKLGKKKSEAAAASIEDKLQRQIIVADCIIHQAMLTFIKQDITSYVKGGWLMRKAYKIYEKLYKNIKQMHTKSLANHQSGASGNGLAEEMDQLVLDAEKDDTEAEQSATNEIIAEYHVIKESDYETEEATEASESNRSDSANLVGCGGQIPNSLSSGQLSSKGSQSSLLSHDVLDRLLGSVSVGYGIFQLSISLIPPKLLKVIKFLGFEGDRELGLKALEFASLSRDMKAPLASLGLIWYHTVIRPFFALDGGAVDSGVADAYVIINRCEREYPDSALFMFFKGRAQRLECKLTEALSTYRQGLQACKGQREIELISYHEIGWIEMMKMNFPECIISYTRLKKDSRWSKSYYAYLTGLCQGASGDLLAANNSFGEVPGLIRTKNNQIEAFVLKRVGKFQKKVSLSSENCSLYILEVLYLWNALTQCPPEDVAKMMETCNTVTDKSVFHLKCLIEGALYRQQGDEQLSSQFQPIRFCKKKIFSGAERCLCRCFEEAIARQEGMKDDAHVSAFAMYELGVTQTQRPETFTQGKHYLTKARDGFKEYDFDNRLSVRVNAALRRLKEEGTPL